MPIHFQKSLQECLPKIKKSNPRIGLPPQRTLSLSTSWILRGCKHPKTQSFACDDQNENKKQEGEGGDDAATLSDIDRFLLENFKSLYKKEDEGDIPERSEEDQNEVLHDKEDKPGGALIESPKFMDPPEDIRGSHRFFVAPGSSSSLMEEARISLTIPCTITSTSEDVVGFAASSGSTRASSSCNDSARTSDSAEETLSPDDFITVLTYSTSPYDDFKKSMQEMIEARLKHNGKIDWEFMEELLFCYLNLNDKKSYKFILRSFVDMIVVLRENSGRIVPAKPRNVRSNSGGSSSTRK